jgi:hypothetical protein
MPNLVSPHLGDRVDGNRSANTDNRGQPVDGKAPENTIVALPLGGRVKIDPWNDRLTVLKATPLSSVTDDEKKPFQITPFSLYLTRQGSHALAQTTIGTVPTAELEMDKKP